jgi:hypothetical protein
MRENLLLRAFAQSRAARNAELRAAFRSSANRSEDAAKAVNTALRNNEPWAFGEEDDQDKVVEDMRVAWFGVFGKLDATQQGS